MPVKTIRRDLCATRINQSAFTRVLVAHAEAGAVCEHAGGDVHGEEFLEEEFCGVGDVDLGDAGFIVAGATFVEAFLELAGMFVSTNTKRREGDVRREG